MSLRIVLLLAVLSIASAWQSGLTRAVASRPVVTMNTGYTDISQIGRKKNPNSGRSDGLKGYTVGSFAPPLAKKSGSRISDMNTGYGIDNRWGGKSRAQKTPAASKSSGGQVDPAVVFTVVSALALLAGNAQ